SGVREPGGELRASIHESAERAAAGPRELGEERVGIGRERVDARARGVVLEELRRDPGELALEQALDELAHAPGEVGDRERAPGRAALELQVGDAELSRPRGLLLVFGERVVVEERAAVGRVPVRDVLREERRAGEQALDELRDRRIRGDERALREEARREV